MNAQVEAIEKQRDADTEYFMRYLMTPALREAIALFGWTEDDYRQRLKAVLFPFPIIYTTSGTNAE